VLIIESRSGVVGIRAILPSVPHSFTGALKLIIIKNSSRAGQDRPQGFRAQLNALAPFACPSSALKDATAGPRNYPDHPVSSRRSVLRAEHTLEDY
jgi:hypothetical protein